MDQWPLYRINSLTGLEIVNMETEKHGKKQHIIRNKFEKRGSGNSSMCCFSIALSIYLSSFTF